MREFVDTYPRGVGEMAGDVQALRGWARASQIDRGRFGYREGMVFLGRGADGTLLGLDDPGHCITVAGSRAGKGVSVIVPNLCLYPGSAVVIDPKGENATLTAARRGQGSIYCEGMGQTVHVLDPFKLVPNHPSATYNPLSVFDPDTPEGRELAIDDAALIADALVTPGGDRDAHWDESARSVLEALILHVVSTERPEHRTLTRVRELLMRGAGVPDPDGKAGGFKALLDGPLRRNLDFGGVVAMTAEALLDLADTERGSILSTARRNTKYLDSPAMKRVLAHSAFDLRDLKRGRMSVYLCLPASRLHTHARWLRLMIGLSLALMEREPTRPEWPVLFFMDEFAALGKLDVIEAAAGLMAGYGVKLWPILQDLSQLKRHYPQSWETFLGNAGLHQFFGNADLTTLEHVSKRLGKTAVLARH
jgi:type IV secretion system protein VirD4